MHLLLTWTALYIKLLMNRVWKMKFTQWLKSFLMFIIYTYWLNFKCKLSYLKGHRNFPYCFYIKDFLIRCDVYIRQENYWVPFWSLLNVVCSSTRVSTKSRVGCCSFFWPFHAVESFLNPVAPSHTILTVSPAFLSQ